MKNIQLFFLLIFFTGCSSGFNDVSEYLEWSGNPDNFHVVEKDVNGYILKLKYLSPEYLTYQELSYLNRIDANEYDSIYSLYDESYTFLLSINHIDDKCGNDIISDNSVSLSDYAYQYLSLSFCLQSQIYIKGKNCKLFPVLTSMEQTTSVIDGRNFFIVFANTYDDCSLQNEDVLDIVFDDEIFNTGINHFAFNQKKLKDIPEFKFLKKIINDEENFIQ